MSTHSYPTHLNMVQWVFVLLCGKIWVQYIFYILGIPRSRKLSYINKKRSATSIKIGKQVMTKKSIIQTIEALLTAKGLAVELECHYQCGINQHTHQEWGVVIDDESVGARQNTYRTQLPYDKLDKGDLIYILDALVKGERSISVHAEKDAFGEYAGTEFVSVSIREWRKMELIIMPSYEDYVDYEWAMGE